MAMYGTRVARTAPIIDLATYAIDDASMQWLEDRLGSRKPKASAVDSLARSSLTPQEQRFMTALLQAMRAGGRNVAVSVTHEGAGEAQRAGFMQATLHAKTREDEVVGKVRGAVAAVLWGQERHLEAFVLAASDHVSSTRTLPAILVVGGERGHGKTEAVAALADGLHTRPGKVQGRVHDVDLSTVTDASAAALFEEDGPLSEKTLRKLVNVGVVCFHGANDLQKRAPQLTLRLQKLLGTARTDADYKSLVYVFDFDQLDGTVVDTMDKALGPVGTYMASDYASFGHLDADTMRRYCLARLPQLLKSKQLGDMRVDFDDAALAIIGAALATPHMPLDSLDARIHQLILNHLDVADDGSKRPPARVQMTVAVDPEEAAAVIANLTSAVPKLSLARKLLRVEPVVVEETPVVADAPATQVVATEKPAASVKPAAPMETPPAVPDETLDALVNRVAWAWRNVEAGSPGAFLSCMDSQRDAVQAALRALLLPSSPTARDCREIIVASEKQRVLALEPAVAVAILLRVAEQADQRTLPHTDHRYHESKWLAEPMAFVSLGMPTGAHDAPLVMVLETLSLVEHASPCERRYMRELATRVVPTEHAALLESLLAKVVDTTPAHTARAAARHAAWMVHGHVSWTLEQYRNSSYYDYLSQYLSIDAKKEEGGDFNTPTHSIGGGVLNIKHATQVVDGPLADNAANELVERPIASIHPYSAYAMVGGIADRVRREDAYDTLVRTPTSANGKQGLAYPNTNHPRPVIVALEIVRLAANPTAAQLEQLRAMVAYIIDNLPPHLDQHAAAYSAILEETVTAIKTRADKKRAAEEALAEAKRQLEAVK